MGMPQTVEEPSSRTASLLRPFAWDVVVYGGSLAFSCWLFATSSFHTYRSWAEVAAPVYAGGVVASVLAAAWLLHRRQRSAGMLVQTLARRVRAFVVAAVTLGACVVPTALGVARRADLSADYAQSEVAVIESAARLLLSGANPYSAVFDSSELVGRAEGIAHHFPYLPGMALFGVPRALHDAVWTDARVFLLLATLILGAVALRRLQSSVRVGVWQVLVAAPTGALALASGGDDLPVIALSLLALSLLAEGRTRSAVAVVLAAACIKQLAWPLLLGVLLSLRTRRDVGRALRLCLVPLILLAAIMTTPGAADDLVLYPLGLTAEDSPVQGRTPGAYVLDLLAHDLPRGARFAVITFVMLTAVVVAELSVRAFVRRIDSSTPDAVAVGAAIRFGVFLAVLIAAAPITRPGYLLYPVNALVWALALGRGRSSPRLGEEEHNEQRTHLRRDWR